MTTAIRLIEVKLGEVQLEEVQLEEVQLEEVQLGTIKRVLFFARSVLALPVKNDLSIGKHVMPCFTLWMNPHP